MKIDFDFNNISNIEFGIGRDENDIQAFSYIPVDDSIQNDLKDMLNTTVDDMQQIKDEPDLLEVSERYASNDYVYIPIDDPIVENLKLLHEAENLPIDGKALNDTSNVFCYFTKFTDAKQQKVTAVRRATQFKGILKSRLLSFSDDTLKIVKAKIFKLDYDFDFIIEKSNILIYRPSGFEFAGKLTTAILEAAPGNAQEISKKLGFVDFTNIEEYVSNHPRAARYLASIKSQGEMDNIDQSYLIDRCVEVGVKTEEENGKIKINEGNIMGFLELLDRRRFSIQFAPDTPERYKAPSRQKMQT